MDATTMLSIFTAIIAFAALTKDWWLARFTARSSKVDDNTQIKDDALQMYNELKTELDEVKEDNKRLEKTVSRLVLRVTALENEKHELVQQVDSLRSQLSSALAKLKEYERGVRMLIDQILDYPGAGEPVWYPPQDKTAEGRPE